MRGEVFLPLLPMTGAMQAGHGWRWAACAVGREPDYLFPPRKYYQTFARGRAGLCGAEAAGGSGALGVERPGSPKGAAPAAWERPGPPKRAASLGMRRPGPPGGAAGDSALMPGRAPGDEKFVRELERKLGRLSLPRRRPDPAKAGSGSSAGSGDGCYAPFSRIDPRFRFDPNQGGS